MREKSAQHFFFDLEKNRGRSELIKELHNKEGELVKGTDDILKEVKEYYGELFSTQGIDEHEKNKLLECVMAKVRKEDKEECDKEISEEEIIEAINMLKGKKSPGIDGPVNEFYKVKEK